jgi:methyl-accepting chemotaxis protein
VERNGIVANQLDRIGPLVGEATEDVKLSVQADQDELGPRVRADNDATINQIVWVSLGAIIAAVLLSFFLVRVIKRPLGGEPRDMERIALQIAKGDLTMDFSDADKASGLYAAMIEMVRNLRHIVSDVRVRGRQPVLGLERGQLPRHRR